jgi:hypothetical protein
MAAFKQFLELEHVCLDHSMLLHVFDVVGLWLSEKHLLAQFSVVGYFHSTTKIALLDVVQYLDPAAEKLFKPHVSWLASQE